MSYRRWKARSSTPGDRNWKAGSLGFAPAAADVKTTAHIGDGTPGTLDMSTYTLISGIGAAADVRYGTARYSGGSTGTCYVPAAADVQDGVNVGNTTGTFTSPAVGKVISDTSWGAGGTEFTGTYHATLVSEVLDSVSFGAGSAETGTYHAPAAAEVISTAVFGPASGTSGTYDVSNVAAGNIRDTVSIGGVSGTFTHTNDYTLISGVVDAAYVVTGHDNYTGGTAGSYPTLEATQAAQYATDQAAVDAAKASVLNTATILGVTGTYDPGSGYSTGYADGLAYQYNADQAEVNAVKAGITTTTTVLGVTGTLNLGLYVLISNVVAAEWVAVGHDNYVGGSAGSYSGSSGTYPAAAYVHSNAGSYGPSGTEYTPALSALANWCLIAGITWPALDEVDGGVHFGPTTGTEYEGSGVNASTVAAAVLDAVASSYNDTGSIGQKINAAGAAADPLLNNVPGAYADGTAGKALGSIAGIAAKTALITTGTAITVVSPVPSSSSIVIYQGDDYKARNSRSLHWDDPGTWPNLTGATVTLTVKLASTGAIELTATGTVEGAGGASQIVRIELTKALTAALTASTTYKTHTFGLKAVLSNTDTETLAVGAATVFHDCGAAG